MVINTKYFGEMDLTEDEQINFPEPLLGFEDSSAYIIIRFYDEPDSLLCLQSCTDSNLAFVLIDPLYVIENYAPALTSDDFKALAADGDTPLVFYAIAVVHDYWKDSTINLRCPIAINPEKRIGRQIIMDDNTYSMRHPINAAALKDEV